MRKVLALCAALAFAYPSSATADPMRTITGDSWEKGGIIFELQGIDAPDFMQGCRRASGEFYRCGFDSRRFLDRILNEQVLRCVEVESGKNRRIVRCTANGRDLGELIVQKGPAIASGRNKYRYSASEAKARLRRSGLWSGEFLRPELWRRAARKQMITTRIVEVPR